MKVEFGVLGERGDIFKELGFGYEDRNVKVMYFKSDIGIYWIKKYS